MFIVGIISVVVITSGYSRQESNPQEPTVLQLTQTGNGYWPSWSPDGTRIAYFNRIDAWFEDVLSSPNWCAVCNLWIMNADGTDNHLLWDGRYEGVYGGDLRPPSWSSDSQFIAIDSGDTRGPVYIIDSSSGEVITEPPLGNLKALVSFSPKDSHIIHAVYDVPTAQRTIFVRDWSSGVDYELNTGGWNPYTEYVPRLPIWSRNGKLLRMRRTNLEGIRLSSPVYTFFSIPSCEELLTSKDPLGTPLLPDIYSDLITSFSGRWTTLSPDPNSPRMFRRSLVIAHIDDGAIQQPAIVCHEGEIFEFQWHPTEDSLVFGAGRRSRNTRSKDTSDIFVVKFP